MSGKRNFAWNYNYLQHHLKGSRHALVYFFKRYLSFMTTHLRLSGHFALQQDVHNTLLSTDTVTVFVPPVRNVAIEQTLSPLCYARPKTFSPKNGICAVLVHASLQGKKCLKYLRSVVFILACPGLNSCDCCGSKNRRGTYGTHSYVCTLVKVKQAGRMKE